MKIECLLIRPGGSKIDLDGKTYHFKPQADGSHVADVTDKDHARRLLGITEGFSAVVDDAGADDGEDELLGLSKAALIAKLEADSGKPAPAALNKQALVDAIRAVEAEKAAQTTTQQS